MKHVTVVTNPKRLRAKADRRFFAYVGEHFVLFVVKPPCPNSAIAVPKPIGTQTACRCFNLKSAPISVSTFVHV
jgi:hypothetical protein